MFVTSTLLASYFTFRYLEAPLRPCFRNHLLPARGNNRRTTAPRALNSTRRFQGGDGLPARVVNECPLLGPNIFHQKARRLCDARLLDWQYQPLKP